MAKPRQAKQHSPDAETAALHEALAALRDSEERYRAVVNSANEGILVYDRELRVTSGNLAAERIVGLPLAQLIGKNGFTSQLACVREDGTPLSPEDRPTRITIRSGQPLTDHVIGIRRADQSITWLAVNTAFLRRPGELEYYGVVSTLSDISARRSAEEDMRRFRMAMDSSTDILVLVDRASMRYVDVNAAACRLLGYSREELLALGPQDIMPMSRAQLEASYDALIADPSAPESSIRSHYRCKDGALLPFESSRQVLRSGKDWIIVAISRDIRERMASEAALRESEERFRQTFELAASGIAHVDLQGRLLRVNGSLCRILGYAAPELIGRSVKEISHAEDRDLTDSQRLRVRRGETDAARFEKRYLRKDGSVVWVDLAVALARDAAGAPAYEIAIFDDITQRKQAEAALHAAHEELKRSNSELAQFAYVASHDLQEPLRMVSSYTQLLARRYGDRFDADAQEFMGYVVDGAARMKQLIEDLLAYSRVGTRAREMQPVALEAPLRRAIGNLRAAIQEAGASVTFDALPTVRGDEMQLAQLFQNLIGNALKFRSASVPRIHVSSLERENEWVVAVTDNGIGIEPAYFERIFMVFQRLHNKGEYPGTGIGLAICKKVVERHGGRIWVESRPGEGSAFHFALPRGTEHEPEKTHG
jgi:PAS domain S-box-containing protein